MRVPRVCPSREGRAEGIPTAVVPYGPVPPVPSSSGSSESEPPLEALKWVEFAHGGGKNDRIHFLKGDKLPGCAKGVHVSDEGHGVGLADVAK